MFRHNEAGKEDLEPLQIFEVNHRTPAVWNRPCEIVLEQNPELTNTQDNNKYIIGQVYINNRAD